MQGLIFHKVCSRWLPQALLAASRCKTWLVASRPKNEFLSLQKREIHHHTPAMTRTSMKWKHPGYLRSKVKSAKSAGKVTAILFWSIIYDGGTIPAAIILIRLELLTRDVCFCMTRLGRTVPRRIQACFNAPGAKSLKKKIGRAAFIWHQATTIYFML